MAPPFWALHGGRRPFLLGRMRMAAALRQFFAARDFVEVETATLVPSPGNETHLHAFATDLTAPVGTRTRLYLRTSPEFACKKLLAAGERRIVEFARSFRNRERGALHRGRACGGGPQGGRRYLGRRFQPRAGREDRTAPRARAGNHPLRISGGAVAARPAESFRAAPRRALRTLCLRGRAGEWLRRAHRCGRATQTARTPDGGEGAHLRRALSDRRGFSERPCSDAGGVRDCARLRSAGHARDRGRSHRRGDVDADIRNVNDRGTKGRRRMLPFRAQLHIVVAVAACLAHPAGAQTYPTQNITLQVAFAAGGIADVVARLAGQKLSERFGQAVVVENRGGAGGNLAAKAVTGAAPDGYTILATTTSLAVNETDGHRTTASHHILLRPISSTLSQSSSAPRAT